MKALLEIAACILAFFLGYGLLIWLAEQHDALIRREHLIGYSEGSAISGREYQNNQPTKGDNQAGSGIGQLTGEVLCTNNEARIAIDPLDKEGITDPNSKNATNGVKYLERVMKNQGEIRISLVVHVIEENGNKTNEIKR
jgi:hypothetical protein